jgi:hypothetical protein
MNDDLKQRLAAFLDDWRPYKDITGEQALAIILDAIDAHGYAIVPKEPTDAMMDAGEAQDRAAAPWSGYSTEYARCEDHYTAMLAAAPKVPK